MTHLRLILVLLLGSLAWPAAAQQWVPRQPIDQPRTGLATAVLDGQIYLLGGQDEFGNVLRSALRYDPETELWFPIPSMRTARVDAAAAVFEGLIFVMGGRGSNGDELDDVEFYDPNTNRWRAFASMTEKRHGLVAVANDTSIVVAGGTNDQDEFLESIEFYSPSENRWVPLLTGDPTDDPLAQITLTPRAALAGAGIGSEIFFLGGFSPRGPVDVVEELRPGGSLVPAVPLPSARGNLAATAISDSLYVVGGIDAASRVLGDVLRLVRGSNTWEEMPRLIFARQGCAVAAAGEALFVFGGTDVSGRVLDSVESLGEIPTTPVAVEDDPPAPQTFGLESNFPNPFQRTTAIPFTVSESERSRHVTLTVYDVQGRRVAVLVDGILKPGRYTVTWDGTDRQGTPVGNGLYVYRLQQGALKSHKMMAILR